MKFVTIFIIWALTAMGAHAQALPDPISPFVNDFADILPADSEERITQDLQNLRDDGVEMTVVTVPNIDGYGDVPGYATALFNKWGVGDAAKNNGILMLVALDNREVFIALGSGYPPKYDDRMDQVFDQYMKSNFQAGQYATGVEAGVLETIARTNDNWVDATSKRSYGKIAFWIAFVGIAFMGLRRKLGDAAVRVRRCPTCGNRTMTRERSTTQDPSIGTKGVQTILTRCQNCDYSHRTERALPVRSSRSTSGGFGGGGSSGGGGGGKW